MLWCFGGLIWLMKFDFGYHLFLVSVYWSWGAMCPAYAQCSQGNGPFLGGSQYRYRSPFNPAKKYQENTKAVFCFSCFFSNDEVPLKANMFVPQKDLLGTMMGYGMKSTVSRRLHQPKGLALAVHPDKCKDSFLSTGHGRFGGQLFFFDNQNGPTPLESLGDLGGGKKGAKLRLSY